MKIQRAVFSVVALTLSSLTLTAPSFSQSTIEPGQPVVGSLHVIEANLDAQLTHDYNAGTIDPLELANMRRDLDAIKVKEEKYRMRSQGIDDNGAQKISDLLRQFQDRLMDKVSEKGHVATATYVEMR